MPAFIIKIRDIGPEGLALDLPFEREWFAEALQGMDVALREGGARVRIEKVGESVLVTGTMRGAVAVPCGRCLAPAVVDLGASVRMTYSRDEELADADSEMADEDVDFSTFSGEEIDLGALFREQILLTIPMTPRCSEACKGLCPQCGRDLNQGSCACARPTH